MEPQIRFCTSTDGVRLAYATMGQGPPLVIVPSGWANNLKLEWKHPDARRYFQLIGQERSLVYFDFRGVALSQRDVENLSHEILVDDVSAIVNHIGLEEFDLWGIGLGTATSVVYAAEHPDRVSRMVLWGAYPNGEAIISQDAMQGLVGLVQSNWSLARRALADLGVPTGPTELRRWFSNVLRESISPEILARYLELQVTVDVRSYLPQVKAPTLVLNRHDDRGMPIAAGRAAAAMIPDARFVALEGDIGHPHFGDVSYIEEVLNFLEGRTGSIATPLDLPPAIDDEKTDPMIGKTISHYRILEKLGEGGMGVVYKAEDTKLKRQVALKFLPAELTRSDELQQRFLREAQAAAALTHPNICIVHEIDETKIQTFIAMEYIDGKSLAERIEAGQLNTDEALEIAIQIAEGLRRAHGRGIIHRDIKSANIILDEFNQAKILDFGLAKLMEQSRLTKTATIMGTVSYMSPEQARGDATIDHRTDIWSVGVVLYEMLTGRLPFDAPSDAALLHKIIYEPVEPIENHRRNLPPALEQAVLKMLQKDAQDRYEGMEAVISDLKSIRSGAAPVIDVEDKTTPSIVVLPFADMSPQRDQEYFCDGISESIINELTQLHDLRVIARTSAFSFKGQNLDVREIGKRLNVGTVLEGSIQTAGERVRVTAQLVNTTGGEHLWSEKYDRSMEDIFAIQDEISEAIVGKLKSRLLKSAKKELAKRQTVDLETYSLYLKGRWFLNKRTEEGMKKGFEHLSEAIEKDPNYAPAHAGLADFYIILGFYGFLSPRMAFPNAKQEALRALEIDDTLGEAHASLAHIMAVYEWEWEEAEREYKRAIELNPGYVTAHVWYALYLMGISRVDKAIERVYKALELDPLSLLVNWFVGIVHIMAQQYDQAMEALKKTIELDPGFPGPHVLLGSAYLNKGMHEEALKMFQKEKASIKGSNPLIESYVGYGLARLGRKDEAMEILKDFQQRSQEVYVPPSCLAGLYFSLGDNNKGFEWLEKGCEEHDFLLFLRVDPSFENVRSDPRFTAVLKKMNLAKPDATVPMIEPPPSIAVLPFVNMSADPEQEYFCDGLSEEIINALTRIKDLKVIARTSAFSFKGRNVNVRDIGRELDVGSILEGSVRKAESRLRITAQLIDTSNGHHLWSDKFDRELKDIFAIQDEISEAIIEKLKPKLLGVEKSRSGKHRTVDLEAYDLYLKGRFFWNKRSEEGMKKAIEYLKEATERDPGFALAYSGLADCYTLMPFYTTVPPTEAFPNAKTAVLKALEIDDTLAEAHTSLALIRAFHDWEWESAENEYRRAVELNPGYAPAHLWYAARSAYMTQFENATVAMKQALRLDPLSIVTNAWMGHLLSHRGQNEKAIEWLKKTVEMDPGHIVTLFYLGYAYLKESMYEEALAAFQTGDEVSKGSTPYARPYIGIAHALMGQRSEAQEVLDDLREKSGHMYIPPFLVALLCFALEETDQAVSLLQRAYEMRDVWLCFLKVHPVFDALNLRSDHRYLEMLKKIGLDQ